MSSGRCTRGWRCGVGWRRSSGARCRCGSASTRVRWSSGRLASRARSSPGTPSTWPRGSSRPPSRARSWSASGRRLCVAGAFEFDAPMRVEAKGKAEGVECRTARPRALPHAAARRSAACGPRSSAETPSSSCCGTRTSASRCDRCSHTPSRSWARRASARRACVRELWEWCGREAPGGAAPHGPLRAVRTQRGRTACYQVLHRRRTGEEVGTRPGSRTPGIRPIPHWHGDRGEWPPT